MGDFMLDRYTFGHADRLSPDAPVPALRVVREEARPGGASHVALCVRALGCEASCAGVVGADHAGDELTRRLNEAGCDTAGVLRFPDRQTTVKQSVVGLAQHRHSQKMIRIDYEQTEELTPNMERRLLKAVTAAWGTIDLLCLQDYNKGVLTASLCAALIRWARSKRIPVIVDPASIRNYRKYAGATAITPNRMEAMAASNADGNLHDRAALVRAGRRLRRALNLKALVMTLDKDGALLLQPARPAAWMATHAREVYDVTGAGDAFVAALACARGNGIDWAPAVQFANCVAGLKVERFGAVPIPLNDVLTALHRRQVGARDKLHSLDELLTRIVAHRQAGRRIAFANGCFDILHAGHVSLLREARRLGDVLVVALNSDASIRRIKGPDRPANSQATRIANLSELESVDYIVLFEEDTPIRVIEAVKPDVLVKGADYRETQVVGASQVKAAGGRVVLVPLVAGLSTTGILRSAKAAARRR